MSTALIFARDKNGFNTFVVKPSLSKYSAVLTTGSEETLTVPKDASKYAAIISTSQGANVWVSVNGTASFPVGPFSASDSDLNPPGLIVQSGDVLSFITNDPNDAYVNVKFYSDIT